MYRFVLFFAFILLTGAIRFHELIPDGDTHFHGIPIQKYISSMNRIREIVHKLNRITDPFVLFEDLDWNKSDFEGNPFLHEGDIVLSEDQLDALVESYEIKLAKHEGRHLSRLFSTNQPLRLWHRFPIPWSVNAQKPPIGGVEMVRSALALWETQTCLTFKENGIAREGRIQFYADNGCFSPIGRIGALNKISIGRGCGELITVAHEIGHSLGLFHVQARFDADKYIDVFMDNVNPNRTGEFAHPPKSYRAVDRGIPYDYGSAMQYGRFTFAKNRKQPTMLPKDRNYNATMGQRFELAFTDVKEVNKMYCNNVCPKKLTCLNGGYTDPKDCSICRCPTGWSGKICHLQAESTPGCGTTSLTATSDLQTLSASGSENCTFLITAPTNKNIRIVLDSAEFQGETDVIQSCDDNFVEIKYADQFMTAGARFCPQHLVGVRSMKSAKHRALVLYKSSEENFQFSLRYKYDIKAANLAVGIDDRTQFYIIDFGLCRSYCEANGEFRRPRKSAPFRGTVRYAPLSCHILRETCRKDDLESWLYSQIEFTRGSLPWRDLTSIVDVGLYKERSRHDIGLAELMGGCPREYIDILRYLDTVKYYETPNYEKCRAFLRAATKHLDNFKPTYDWIDENLQAGNGNADATVADEQQQPKQ